MKLQTLIEEKTVLENEKIDIYMNENKLKVRPAKITKDGRALFFETHNIDSSRDTKTNELNSGGDLNLNLEGEGLKIGVWDEGHVFKDHDEFQNLTERVIFGNDIGFELNYDSHATHVAGTIGASGANPNAKGMAPKVKIVSFDWNNAFLELIRDSSSDIYVSNHSYGIDAFSENGQPSFGYDYFGTYDDWAEELDAIHFARPNFIAVCSAGNDGLEDNFEAIVSGYDVLTDMSTAKNNFVVANAKNILYFSSGALLKRINESSSQGPTNDLRVKPDITGIGTDVLSSDLSSNLNVTNGYSSSTGTSMAAPNIAGSLLLLMEYFFDTKGELPLSSTLKALVINNALDAGDSGPDPNFGWGIMDSSKSAVTISENVNYQTILEGQINQGEEIILPLDFYNLNTDFSVTICWTDPEGESLENASNKNTSVLINDIDLRIIENESIEHLPYKLSSENKVINNKWAIKADNSVDNVERVDFSRNSGASYKIKITHKGDLFNPSVEDSETNYQNYSVVVSNGAYINSTLNSDKIGNNFQDYFTMQNRESIIFLNNLKEERVNKISIYSIDGRILYNEMPEKIQKRYRIEKFIKSGIIIIETNEFRFIKRFVF